MLAIFIYLFLQLVESVTLNAIHRVGFREDSRDGGPMDEFVYTPIVERERERERSRVSWRDKGTHELMDT